MPTADERTALIRVKVERAKKHLGDLQSAVHGFIYGRRFGHSDAYDIRIKRDPQTRQLIYYVHSVKPIPPGISAVIGDVLGNLRSALDYIAYQLFTLKHPAVDPPGDLGFPICDSPEKYKATMVRNIERLGKNAVDLISAIKPYKCWNELYPRNGALWSLHRLNNINKHRLLLTVCTQYGAHSISPRESQELSAQFPEEPMIDFLSSIGVNPTLREIPVKEGYELHREPADAEPYKEMTFEFEISLNEPKIVGISPALPLLQHLADLVDGIVGRFEPLLG